MDMVGVIMIAIFVQKQTFVRKKALEISRNQLDYDEKNKKTLRYTLEELLLLNQKELKDIRLKDFQKNWAPKLGPLKGPFK